MFEVHQAIRVTEPSRKVATAYEAFVVADAWERAGAVTVKCPDGETFDFSAFRGLLVTKGLFWRLG